MTMQLDITEVKLEIYTPQEYVEELRNALTLLGACRIGDYDHVVSYQDTKGFWRPLEQSNPFNGEKGTICSGSEIKMEVRCPADQVREALRTIRTIHPYEEPVVNILPLLNQYFDVK